MISKIFLIAFLCVISYVFYMIVRLLHVENEIEARQNCKSYSEKYPLLMETFGGERLNKISEEIKLGKNELALQQFLVSRFNIVCVKTSSDDASDIFNMLLSCERARMAFSKYKEASRNDPSLGDKKKEWEIERSQAMDVVFRFDMLDKNYYCSNPDKEIDDMCKMFGIKICMYDFAVDENFCIYYNEKTGTYFINSFFLKFIRPYTFIGYIRMMRDKENESHTKLI